MVHSWCCEGDIEYITRKTGITVGDVVDTARRTCAEHEHSPVTVQKSSYSPSTHTRYARYPKFCGEFHLPEDHRSRQKAKVIRDAVPAEDKQRVEAYEEAGWGEICYAFREACGVAAASGMDMPTWPEFLALNKSLVPQSYELSAVEADATEYPRRLWSTGDEAIA